MNRDRIPREAQAGVISGRIVLVLIASTGGAILALGTPWLLLFAPG